MEHYLASRTGPKSLRRLPPIARAATRMARQANPRVYYACSAAQWVIALLLGVQVLLGKLALEAILDADQTGGSVADALPPLIGLVAANAISSVATAMQTQGQRLLGEYVQRLTLDEIFGVTTSVDLETFESPDFFDDLQRVQSTALTRPLTMTSALVQTFGGLLAVVGLSIALALIEPILIPVLLLSALPLWLISRRTGALEFQFNVDQTPSLRLRYYLVSILTGRDEAKELRAFELGAPLRERWDRVHTSYIDALRTHVARRLKLSLAGALATIVVTSAAFALLISFVLDDRVDLASAGAAVLAIRLLGTQVERTFAGITNLFESSLFLQDMNHFLARRPPDGPAAGDPGDVVAPFEELRVEDVHFAYPGSDAEALRGVSMTIRAGEVIALVGENGSGKTTLAKLLGALFTPTAGRVAWDGTDVRELDPRAMRRNVGVIFQDFVRFQLTARENIGFGQADRIDDLDGIRAAAEQAGAADYIERLPDGYDTNLGKVFFGGHDLSGGQWQRIAIARAFFRGAGFMVLDEPTASLDARSENELFDRVQELSRGRAVLLISHRFSTVKSADRIYVLHQGEIIEAGSHDELMAQGGRYAELFDLQAAAYR
jgi:ATP-binding cassette subfamily B protein